MQTIKKFGLKSLKNNDLKRKIYLLKIVKYLCDISLKFYD